jgi:hypothetical protein
LAPYSAAQVTTGAMVVTVATTDSDGTRSSVPGTSVSIKGTGPAHQAVTDQKATCRFEGLAPGQYQVEATAPGLTGSAAVTVIAGAEANVIVDLQIALLKESVTVTADADRAGIESSEQSTVDKRVLLNSPNKDDRFDSALPLIPGVVRGPDGLINMKGARSSQAGALINSANVTDPVTGNSAMSLPIDVVQSVTVISNPYDPEYGRLSGAVSRVETTTGNFDGFHASVQNLFVRPRKRGGDFVGIESWTPRATVTGPLIKNKIAITQSFEYRFVRTPVYSLPPLERDVKFEGVNSFTQADVNLTPRQSMTVSFALYPQKVNYFGLNTFTPQPSTPDVHQRGEMVSVQHRDAIGADSLLISQFSFKRFDTDVTANSTDPYQLLVETTEGGYFNLQKRNSRRTGWQEIYQFGKHGLGSHQIKVGSDFAHSSYDGGVDLLPVSIIGTAGLPAENIGFGPAARFTVSQNEFAWFVADKWTPFHRLTVDLGMRFDWDSVTGSTHPAPRVGFALLLTKDSKTVLRGGAGLFYDRVPLNIVSFPYLPGRTVTTFGPTGDLVSSVGYANTIPAGLRNPRSASWNVEIERELTTALLVRGAYQQRSTTRDFVLDPLDRLGILSLTNRGSSIYHEFQATARYKLRRATLNASYVRSKAYGNLNDFNQFFGNNGVPVIEPDERGRQPFDAPNRFLAWGEWQAPFKLTMLPVLDIHTGFPWSSFDQARNFVGPRNSERYPRFTSFDLQVTRPVRLPIPHEKIKARVGFSAFNLLNHFNPRDVQGDIDSVRYAGLFNGVGRTFRGKFILEF